MVDKELIAEIKNSVNIVEVIGEVVSLTKAGSNFLGICLFHGEKTPSFTIVSDVVALEMSLSLLRTTVESPLWMRSRS